MASIRTHLSLIERPFDMLRALLVGSVSVILLANLLGAIAPKEDANGINRSQAIEREMQKYE